MDQYYWSAALRFTRLSTMTKLVAMCIKDHVNTETGQWSISQADIAEEATTTVKSVRIAVRELVNADFLTILEVGKWRGDASRYALKLPGFCPDIRPKGDEMQMLRVKLQAITNIGSSTPKGAPGAGISIERVTSQPPFSPVKGNLTTPFVEERVTSQPTKGNLSTPFEGRKGNLTTPILLSSTTKKENTISSSTARVASGDTLERPDTLLHDLEWDAALGMWGEVAPQIPAEALEQAQSALNSKPAVAAEVLRWIAEIGAVRRYWLEGQLALVLSEPKPAAALYVFLKRTHAEMAPDPLVKAPLADIRENPVYDHTALVAAFRDAKRSRKVVG